MKYTLFKTIATRPLRRSKRLKEQHTPKNTPYKTEGAMPNRSSASVDSLSGASGSPQTDNAQDRERAGIFSRISLSFLVKTTPFSLYVDYTAHGGEMTIEQVKNIYLLDFAYNFIRKNGKYGQADCDYTCKQWEGKTELEKQKFIKLYSDRYSKKLLKMCLEKSAVPTATLPCGEVIQLIGLDYLIN